MKRIPIKYFFLFFLIYIKSSIAFEPEIRLWGERTNNNSQIYLSTNLPEGTTFKSMLISPTKFGGTGKILDRTFIVNFDGNIFLNGSNGFPENLSPGTYVLSLGLIQNQPQRVLKILGSNGENLTGDNIQMMGSTKTVDISRKITIPNTGEILFNQIQKTTQPPLDTRDNDTFEMLKHELRTEQDLIKQIGIAVRCGTADERNGNYAIGKLITGINITIVKSRLSPEKSLELDKLTKSKIKEAEEIASEKFCSTLNPVWRGQIRSVIHEIVSSPI